MCVTVRVCPEKKLQLCSLMAQVPGDGAGEACGPSMQWTSAGALVCLLRGLHGMAGAPRCIYCGEIARPVAFIAGEPPRSSAGWAHAYDESSDDEEYDCPNWFCPLSEYTWVRWRRMLHAALLRSRLGGLTREALRDFWLLWPLAQRALDGPP